MTLERRRPQDTALRKRGEHSSAGVIVAVIVGLTLFVYFVRGVLLPFVVAGVVAYLCTPVVNGLAARTRWPRWIVASCGLIGLTGVVVGLGFVAAPSLWREITAITGDLQGTLTRAARDVIGDGPVNLLGTRTDAAGVAAMAVNGVRVWLGSGGALVAATWSFAALFGSIMTWVLLGYFMLDGPRIWQGLRWLIPPGHRAFASRVWSDLDPVLRRYFIGVAIVVAYASSAAYLGLGLILGLRHAGFLAFLTGLLEIIPLVGPAGSAAIAGLVAVQQAKSSWNIFAYVIYAIALRLSIDQLVGPVVLGRAAALRPVVVIFAFLCGGILLGPLGIVLAVPFALSAKVVLTALYESAEADSG